MVEPGDRRSLLWRNVPEVQLEHQEGAVSRVLKCTHCAQAGGTS